jgi:hypothetical protein
MLDKSIENLVFLLKKLKWEKIRENYI